MLRSLLSALAAFAVLASLMSAPVPPEKKPDWMPAFRKAYELKEGEYVRRVAPPYIKERMDFSLDAYGPPKYPEADRDNRKYYEDGYKNRMTLFVDQEGRRLFRRMTISSDYLADKPELQRGGNLFEVSEAVQCITGYEFPECIVDPAFAKDPLFEKGNLTVNGDFVVRRNTPMEKLAPALEKILNEECKVRVRLRVDVVEQDVFVITGSFGLKPPEWQEGKKRLDVYATEAGLNKEYDDFLQNKGNFQTVKTRPNNGTPSYFVRFLGYRLRTRMVWDEPLPATPKFEWHDHYVRNPDKQDEADDRDPEKVLKHASEQTGLKFTKAKRKVPVLVLSPKK